MQRVRAHGREARGGIGEGEGVAERRKKPQKTYRHDVEKRGRLGCMDSEKWTRECSVQYTSIQDILKTQRNQTRKRKALRIWIRTAQVERVGPLCRVWSSFSNK